MFAQPDTKKKVQRRYQALSLPPYLVILIKRFSKNNWDFEKNPTIVNFPIKNADFVECELSVLFFFFLFFSC